jgi:hypothetical protein
MCLNSTRLHGYIGSPSRTSCHDLAERLDVGLRRLRWSAQVHSAFAVQSLFFKFKPIPCR